MDILIAWASALHLFFKDNGNAKAAERGTGQRARLHAFFILYKSEMVAVGQKIIRIMTKNMKNASSVSSSENASRCNEPASEPAGSNNSKGKDGNGTPSAPIVEGYIIKVMEDLSVSKLSVNNEDFVEVLNTVSPQLGGLTNLGVFCDIISIEQTSAVLSDVEEQFIHVETVHEEQPYNRLHNDGSSVNPYDFSFHHLLNE